MSVIKEPIPPILQNIETESKIKKTKVEEPAETKTKQRKIKDNNKEQDAPNSKPEKKKTQRVNKSLAELEREAWGSDVVAAAYGIFEASSLKLITSKNETEKRQIASLAKLMTLLTSLKLIEHFKIQTKNTYFRVSIIAGSLAGTLAELEPMEWVTVEDLLYGLMLPSGNDAAVVLAENFGAFLFYEKKDEIKKFVGDMGNVDNFVQFFVDEMNKIGKELDMKDTVFTNVHGLESAESFSTIIDLGILLKNVTENKEALKIISSRSYFAKIKVSGTKKDIRYREIDWLNTNKLLWKKGYIAGKTGNTQGAGTCLASFYENLGQKYFILVLGSVGEERFKDTEKLVNNNILSK